MSTPRDHFPADHEIYAELAAGYALSALEPDDEQRFVTHLSACAECTTEVGEHERVLAQLAYDPEVPSVPPQLLESIREGVRRSGRGVVFESPPEERPPPPVADLGQTRAVRLRRTARERSGTLLAAAAVIVLVLGFGGYVGISQADRGAEQARTDRLATAVHELGLQGSRSVPLRDSGGRAVALVVVNGAQMSVVVDELAPNESGSTYVLWGRAGVEVRAVGAFDVNASAPDAALNLRMPGDVSQLNELMVTKEPGKVAPAQPGSPVLASGQV